MFSQSSIVAFVTYEHSFDFHKGKREKGQKPSLCRREIGNKNGLPHFCEGKEFVLLCLQCRQRHNYSATMRHIVCEECLGRWKVSQKKLQGVLKELRGGMRTT